MHKYQGNSSGTFLAPPAAALEKEGDGAFPGSSPNLPPRAPARAHRPPDGVCVPLHPLLNSYVPGILLDAVLLLYARLHMKGYIPQGLFSQNELLPLKYFLDKNRVIT